MYELSSMEDEYNKLISGFEIFSKMPEISVGTTPHEIVYTEDKMRILHYLPTVGKTHPVPILMVYALVNRYYILDLQSDKSVVKKLLDDGFDVYIIDWGYPSGVDRYITLNDYINGYLNNAVNLVRKRSGLDKITLMGICQGGTFSVMYSALYPEKVKNLIAVVAPINFDTQKGLLHIWAKNLDVDKVVDYYGIVPGDFLNAGFLLTDPFRLMIDKYVGMFDRIECEPGDEACLIRNEEIVKNFLRMEKWIFDSPDQAGEAFRQFIKDLYQKNLLIQNKFELDGKKINLKNITMPLLNIMAESDHLVPNEASIPLNDAVSSKEKEMAVFPTGHIGIFVGSKSQKGVCPLISKWLSPKSGLDEEKTPDIKNKTSKKKSKKELHEDQR